MTSTWNFLLQTGMTSYYVLRSCGYPAGIVSNSNRLETKYMKRLGREGRREIYRHWTRLTDAPGKAQNPGFALTVCIMANHIIEQVAGVSVIRLRTSRKARLQRHLSCLSSAGEDSAAPRHDIWEV